MGKGDKWRPTKLDAYRDNFDNINWSTKEKCCERCHYGHEAICLYDPNRPTEVAGNYKCPYFLRRKNEAGN